MILKDGIRSHPKLLKVTPEACWLWVTAIDYSRAHLLDGFVPAESLDVLGRFRAPQRLAHALVSVGLFDQVDGGYRIHDFLAHNDSADAVRDKRARDLERKRARIPRGIQMDSEQIPDGKKDARAIARERVGVCIGIGSGSTAFKEPQPSPRVDPLSPSVWDLWRETGEAHGYPQTATPRGTNLQQNVATIRGLVRDDAELHAALVAWWPSPTPRADQRTLGHFAGHLPGVLRHIRSGATGAWGSATAKPTADDEGAARLAAWAAQGAAS